MRSLLIGMASAGLVASSAGAFAQDSQRYQLQRTEDGYVRLDTQTGEMSICVEREDQLLCRPADRGGEKPARDSGEPEHRGERMVRQNETLQREIDRLARSVRLLERRVAQLEQSPSSSNLPSEEEFDKSLGYMQKFFRSFMDIMREQDNQDPAVPDKT